MYFARLCKTHAIRILALKLRFNNSRSEARLIESCAGHCPEAVRRKSGKSTSIYLKSENILVFCYFAVPKWRRGIGTCESSNDAGQTDKAETTFFLVISAFYEAFLTF